jgi:hypothetical protein
MTDPSKAQLIGRFDWLPGRLMPPFPSSWTYRHESGKSKAVGSGLPDQRAGLARTGDSARHLAVPAGQRSSTDRYARSGGPTYSWRGLPILVAGSSIISRHCAIQPGSRPRAKSTVNIRVGNPIAL